MTIVARQSNKTERKLENGDKLSSSGLTNSSGSPKSPRKISKGDTIVLLGYGIKGTVLDVVYTPRKLAYDKKRKFLSADPVVVKKLAAKMAAEVILEPGLIRAKLETGEKIIISRLEVEAESHPIHNWFKEIKIIAIESGKPFIAIGNKIIGKKKQPLAPLFFSTQDLMNEFMAENSKSYVFRYTWQLPLGLMPYIANTKGIKL